MDRDCAVVDSTLRPRKLVRTGFIVVGSMKEVYHREHLTMIDDTRIQAKA